MLQGVSRCCQLATAPLAPSTPPARPGPQPSRTERRTVWLDAPLGPAVCAHLRHVHGRHGEGRSRRPPAAARRRARARKPNGQLLFLEHVRSDDARLARWQDGLHWLIGRVGDCSRHRLRPALPLEVDPVDPSGEWLRHIPRNANPYHRPEPPGDSRRQHGRIVDALYLAHGEATLWAEWYRHLAEHGIPPLRQLPRDAGATASRSPAPPGSKASSSASSSPTRQASPPNPCHRRRRSRSRPRHPPGRAPERPKGRQAASRTAARRSSRAISPARSVQANALLGAEVGVS